MVDQSDLLQAAAELLAIVQQTRAMLADERAEAELSPEQKAWRDKAERAGVIYRRVRSVEEARRAVEEVRGRIPVLASYRKIDEFTVEARELRNTLIGLCLGGALLMTGVLYWIARRQLAPVRVQLDVMQRIGAGEIGRASCRERVSSPV